MSWRSSGCAILIGIFVLYKKTLVKPFLTTKSLIIDKYLRSLHTFKMYSLSGAKSSKNIDLLKIDDKINCIRNFMNYYAVMDYSRRLSIQQENLGNHLQSSTTFSPITYLIQFLVVIFLLRSLIIIPNLSLYKEVKLIIKPCRFIAGTTLDFLLIALEKMCPFKTLMWNLMM